MTTKDEAIKLALEALEWEEAQTFYPSRMTTNAITALREALNAPLAEQPAQQEPVAWAENDGDGNVLWNMDSCFSDDPEWLDNPMPLYTRPQAREPLTDERLELIGHADLGINNIYIFNGYGEEVPEGRTPIYAGYKAAHGIKEST